MDSRGETCQHGGSLIIQDSAPAFGVRAVPPRLLGWCLEPSRTPRICQDGDVYCFWKILKLLGVHPRNACRGTWASAQ